MTDLTPKNYLTSGATTDAQFQEGIGALYDFVSQLAVGAGPQYPEIVDGYLVPDESSCFIIIDTENDAATDILTNISPQYTGVKTIYLKPTANGRSITLKHMGGGTGQLFLAAEADITMDNRNCMMALHYNQTLAVWEELWRNWGLYIPSNNARNEIRTALGLGTAAQYNVGTASGNIPLVSNLGALAFKGIIDAANLVQDRILTLAKFANGTPNQLIGYNSEGVATSVAIPSSRVRLNRQAFTTSGDFVVPEGVFSLDVLLIGGGGGGGGRFSNGGGGGLSSFNGTTVVCSGGAPGLNGSSYSFLYRPAGSVSTQVSPEFPIIGTPYTGTAEWSNPIEPSALYYKPSGSSIKAPYGQGGRGMGGGSPDVYAQNGGPGALFYGSISCNRAIKNTSAIVIGGGGGAGNHGNGIAATAGTQGYCEISWIEPV